MGFRFRKSFRIAPGIRLNLSSKSTSVRFGPKGLGYTISSNGKKRVTASIPGTGISYSEVISSAPRSRPVHHRALATAPVKGKTSFWPWAIGVIGLVISFGIFGNNAPTTNPSQAAPQTRTATTSPTAPLAQPAPAIAAPAPSALAAVPSLAPAVPDAALPPSIEVRFVTASSLNVRSSPSTGGDIVGKIPNGHQIAVIEKDNGWLLVQSAAGGRGWVSEQYTSTSRPAPVASPPPQTFVAAPSAVANRDAIIQEIIRRSILNYSGNCPCPYNTMRNGRSCGGNSAYSKPGGRSPICYASDVTDAMIATFRP